MKKQILGFDRFILLACAALAAPVAEVYAVPQAPVITYGLVRDEYGVPLSKASAARLTLVKEGVSPEVVCATCAVGDYAIAGMNYRLSLEIDSEGPTRAYAATVGTPMRIRAALGDADVGLTPTPVFATPAQGTKQRLDYTIGTDADGDGLPDAWEKWVLELAGRPSDAAAVAAFRPNDDADGDGMTNRAEYLAGTDPFLATDLLEIVAIARDATPRAAVTFTTALERKYRLLMSETLENPSWMPVATSRTADGDLVYEPYPGTGRKMTVYTDAAAAKLFFKVAAE